MGDVGALAFGATLATLAHDRQDRGYLWLSVFRSWSMVSPM